MLPKRLAIWLTLGAALPLGLRAQYNNNATPVDIANLREDINGLDQRLAELTLRVEQLENHAARSAPGASAPSAVTPAQLTEAVASLSAQIAELRAALGKAGHVSAPTVQAEAHGTPAEPGFPRQGIVYTVQKGDTLALIVKKTGGKFQDIVNANRLQDPSHIVIGQQLFIPGGKQ